MNLFKFYVTQDPSKGNEEPPEMVGLHATTNLDGCVEKKRHYSADNSLCSQGYGIPSGHGWM